MFPKIDCLKGKNVDDANKMTSPPEGVGADPPSGAEDRVATELRGLGRLGILAILLILSGNFLFSPLSAILVLVWVWLSRTPWHAIGFVRPKSWLASLAIGIGFGSVLKLLMKTIVVPLLGADPINQAYHYLAGNTAALPGMIVTVVIVAGFGEETVYRGWMFERLRRCWGTTVWARALTVLLTSIVFGLAHYPVQGRAGVEQAILTGLVFGTIFAVTHRIFMVMVAHAAFDLVALAIIYWDIETSVAHFIFK
jgi:membrane protease YdiL (CAAX protease family)